MTTPPDKWGNDALTAYLEDYRRNQWAAFANKGQAITDLIKIDSLFLKLLENAVNPKPLLPMGFMLRSHSAYRSAVGAIMGGQQYEAQALLRLCLEHAAYGFYIGDDVDLWMLWMNRTESKASRDEVRKKFTHAKIKKYISSRAPKLAATFEKLYERMIDFGAHPNEQGYSVNSEMHRVDNTVHINSVYLHGDGGPLDLGLRTAAQIGLWALHIMQLLYPTRFDLLGIRLALEQLRTRF